MAINLIFGKMEMLNQKIILWLQDIGESSTKNINKAGSSYTIKSNVIDKVE